MVGRQNADTADALQLRDIAMATIFCLSMGYSFSCMIASDMLFDSRDGFSGLYGYMDDVMFAHNQRGKGHTNRAYTQSDSRGGSTCGEVMTFTVAL